MQIGLLGAMSPEEQRGLLEPYERQPNPMAGLLGEPVLSRMRQADDAQRARWDAGERSPTPLTEDNMWLADDVAGGLVGPMAFALGAGPGMADNIAKMLRQGRAAEVTDDMLGALGPNDQRRLYELYESGATGMDLPMDEASRMARAEQMKFMDNYETYHGTGDDVTAFRQGFRQGGDGEAYKVGVYSAYSPGVAETYAPNVQGGNIMPLATRTTIDDVRVDAGGKSWNNIDMGAPVTRTGGPDGTIREIYPGAQDNTWGARTNTIAREAMRDGAGSLRVDNTWDVGGFYNDQAGMRSLPPHDVRTDFYPHNIRSRFARFDPRLARNANLLASMGGAGLLGYGMAPEEEP